MSSQYQSLPNLSFMKPDTRNLHVSRMDTCTGNKMSRMPHMGTSRLVTPPKPPRIRSVLVNNNHFSLDRPRTKISTSTVLLNRSNTSIGHNLGDRTVDAKCPIVATCVDKTRDTGVMTRGKHDMVPSPILRSEIDKYSYS